MSRRLLDKTLLAYGIFAVMLVLIAFPLFYFATDRLFLDEADETLLLHKKEFIKNSLPRIHKTDIPLWNALSRDSKIEPANFKLNGDTLLNREYLDTLDNENEPYRVLLAPVEIDHVKYHFMARRSSIETADLVLNMAGLFCLVLLFLLGGLFAITRFLSGRLWIPFYKTIEATENFQLDSGDALELPLTKTEEFTRLNQAINRLLERNLSSFKSQKEFIENASHELQTPLAVFQAQLDILSQQLPLTAELSNTLTGLNDAAGRLARINKNLLMLSKIENNQFQGIEAVEIEPIVRKQAEFLSDQAAAKGISVSLEVNAPPTLQVNSTLFEIAVNNLFLNALRHNHPSGYIKIVIDSSSISISNSSTVKQPESPLLFKRFNRSPSSSGAGLGLSIVSKIAMLHQWQFSHSYDAVSHVFRIDYKDSY